MPKEPRPRNLALFTDDQLAERWPLISKGIAEYNNGFFFEAHEVWEDVWYQAPVPARTFLQGLIQVAAAFVHFVRHEYPGTIGLLSAAIEKLEQFDDGFLGIDVARLLDEARRAREELLALGPDRFQEFDRSHLPQIHLK